MGVENSKLLLDDSHIKTNYTCPKRQYKTIPDYLKYYASVKPQNEAFVFASTDGPRVAVTWKQLLENCTTVAKSLKELGVQSREVVAINIGTSPEWLFVAFGAVLIGAIPVGVSFTYTDGSDLVALMKNLERCSILLMDEGVDKAKWKVILNLTDDIASDGAVRSEQMPTLRHLIIHSPSGYLNGRKSVYDLLQPTETDIELPEVFDENDIAFLFQTSGSTGIPKLGAHTHKSILSNNLIHKDVNNIDDICFNDRPFAYMGGFYGILSGQTRVTITAFCTPPEDRMAFCIDVIRRERCNVVIMLPPQLHEVMKRKENQGICERIKTILTGGQPIMRHTYNCAKNMCEYFVVLYGSSEHGVATGIVYKEGMEFMDCAAGTPLYGPSLEIKVVNENGITVPIGEHGEIRVRSEGNFPGYFNDPHKTKIVLTDDGWYKTGDIGWINAEGTLFVEGRKSYMIISGGMNVVPEILEAAIKTCPMVESVVVVPVPHPVLYQAICACVIPKAGYDVDEQILKKYCEDIHSDKPRLFTVLPKYYLILERFPELSTGKVGRKALEKLAANKFASES